jgi:hypothetical protein
MCTAIAVGSLVAGASADEVEVLANGNYLFRYDTRTGEVSRFAKVGGLLADERLFAIETGNGRLYGLTDERVYAIDPITRNATPVGPRVDDLRLVLGLGYRNFAFDFPQGSDTATVLLGTSPPGSGPVTGTRMLTFDVRTFLVSENSPGTGDSYQLAYATDDPGFGTEPVVRAATHRFDPDAAGATEFIGIDSARSALVRIGPLDGDPLSAEGSVVRTIAPISGLEAGDTVIAMDNSIDGPLLATPLVLAQSANPMVTPMYALDPDTGVMTKLPDMGTRLAIDISAPPAFTVEATRELELTRFGASVDLTGRDRSTATLVGKIEVPYGGWGGKRLRVDFGGEIREFVLDKWGRGMAGRDRFKVSRKPKDGAWLFTLQLRHGEFRTLPRGSDDQPTGTAPIVIDVFVDDLEVEPIFRDVVAYRAQFDVDFHDNRAGKAVLSRHAP